MLEENNKLELIIKHLLNSEIEDVNDNKEHIEKASWLIRMIIDDKFFDAKNDLIDVSEEKDEEIVNLLCEKMKHIFDDCTNHEAIKIFVQKIVSIDHFKIKVNVRYEEITKIVFDSNSEISIEKLNERIEYFSMNIAMMTANNKNENELLKINKVLEKLFRHLKLAFFQKQYFMSAAESATKISNQAEQTAKEAEKVATQAQEMANKAQIISGMAHETVGHAKRAAKKAEDIASSTRQMAHDANDQIKEAKKSSESMMVNYVTILGIFATIIITVFGGINIIGSTVKLLEDNSKLTYLVFIVSFLMICLLVLIRTLTSWISSLNNYREDKVIVDSPKSFFKTSVVCFLIVVVVSGVTSIINKPEDNSKKDDIKEKLNSGNVLFMNIGK